MLVISAFWFFYLFDVTAFPIYFLPLLILVVLFSSGIAIKHVAGSTVMNLRRIISIMFFISWANLPIDIDLFDLLFRL